MRARLGLLTGAIVLMLTACASGLAAEAKPASIDLAKASPEFGASLKKWDIPPSITLSFLDENHLFIAIASDFGFEAGWAADHSSPKKLSATLLFIYLSDRKLHVIRDKQFDIKQSFWEVASVVPTGGILLNTGADIELLDSSGNVQITKSVFDVCGMPPWPPSTMYKGVLTIGSSDIAVLTLARDELKQVPQSYVVNVVDVDTQFCWFNAKTLTPIARISTPGFMDRDRTARRDHVMNQAHDTSPQGISQLLADKDCPYYDTLEQKQEFSSAFDYLHDETDAIGLSCGLGLVGLRYDDGRFRKIDLKNHSNYPHLQTDAWNAPLAIYTIQTNNIDLLGQLRGQTTNAELVNYRTGSIHQIPAVQMRAGVLFFAQVGAHFAISPNGSHYAQLVGSKLYVYDTPKELLQ